MHLKVFGKHFNIKKPRYILKKRRTLLLARTAILTAVYVALTYCLIPIAHGTIQFRISEALTLLPLVFPESVFAVFFGCALANITSPFGIYDIVIGSLVTLIAGFLTFLVGKYVRNTALKIFLGGLPPVLLNAFILPVIWYFFGGETVYWLNVLSVFISQTLSVYLIGIPLYFGAKRLKNYQK